MNKGQTTSRHLGPTWRARPARRRPSGFSLIELLLVVVLMSLLTAGVAVSLSGSTERHALRVAAHDLASAVRFGAGEARRRKCPVRLTFADDGRAFTIEARQDVTGTLKPVEGAAGALRRFPATVRVGEFYGRKAGQTGASLVWNSGRTGRDSSVASRSKDEITNMCR